MRPRKTLYELAVSRNSNSSMPNCQPSEYSASVASPNAPTTSANACARRRSEGEGRSARMSMAEAASTNPTAVLAFICTAPGSTLLSNGKSNTQPASTTIPAAAVKPAASRTSNAPTMGSLSIRADNTDGQQCGLSGDNDKSAAGLSGELDGSQRGGVMPCWIANLTSEGTSLTRSFFISRRRLMKKLRVSDVPSLVKFAIQHGITPPR